MALAKLTSKNQLTLPRAIVESVDSAEYFQITVERGSIILTPVQMRSSQAVRDKIVALGITEEDVADAVTWARK